MHVVEALLPTILCQGSHGLHVCQRNTVDCVSSTAQPEPTTIPCNLRHGECNAFLACSREQESKCNRAWSAVNLCTIRREVCLTYVFYVHIHAGKSCAERGPHFFSGDTDIWTDVQYTSTNSKGEAKFTRVLKSGVNTDIDGRVFVVHNAAGLQVACGKIESRK